MPIMKKAIIEYYNVKLRIYSIIRTNQDCSYYAEWRHIIGLRDLINNHII